MSEAMNSEVFTLGPWDWRETGVKHPMIMPEHEAFGLVLPPGMENGCSELEDLWVQTLKELTDREFKNRTHGSRRTAEAGCQGPICKKAVREHGRRRIQGEASGRYKYLDRVIEYFEHDAIYQLERAEKEALRRMSNRF